MSTIRLTATQALVRHLCNQFTVLDGERVPLCPRRLRHFRPRQRRLPVGSAGSGPRRAAHLTRQNEQSVALAAIGFAKIKRRRQIMVATPSIGPGALNMVTTEGVAHSNCLPILLLSGDSVVNRRPGPEMQQVEHFGTRRSTSTTPSRR